MFRGGVEKWTFPNFEEGHMSYVMLHLLSHKKSVEKANESLHVHRTVIFEPTKFLDQKVLFP